MDARRVFTMDVISLVEKKYLKSDVPISARETPFGST